MGKTNSTNKKTSSKAKGGKKNKKTVVGAKDPIGVRIVFSFFIIFMILSFAVGSASLFLSSICMKEDGMITLGDKYYVEVYEFGANSPNEKGMVFDSKAMYTKGSTVGFKHINIEGKTAVSVGVYKGKDADNFHIIQYGTKPENVAHVSEKMILGAPVDSEGDILATIFLTIAGEPLTLLYAFAVSIGLTIILGLIYFLVSPRGAKQLDKSEEKVVVQTVTTVNSENSELLSHYLSSDDNIQPIEREQNETGALLNINYYNSVRLHNGEVYAVVKKYQETARRLEEYGASDMDIIKMNMIGNSEFDDLILNTHKEKSMTLWEVIDFARTLEGVYCVKKRGTLNWTYKYKSKTLFIVKRDDDESEGYKVSIKVYPDAATKLNIIYKALEDSSFPIGPYWYMFNDLRNLPANVIKWLMRESLNISKWQQVKADLLRDNPTLESYKLDADYMHDMILANTRMLDMGKFIIINQNDTADEVKYDTVLKTGFENINMDQFTKEIAMSVPNLKNVQMSLLTRKNASEALVNALCNELLDFAPKAETTANGNNLNNVINTPSTTKVMKKKKK